MRDAVIVSTARTPIGKAYRGAFNATGGQQLAGHAIHHAVARAGIEGHEVDDVIMGAALQQGSTGTNIARQAAVRAGLGITAPGMSLDRQCASGMMAIATAAKQVITDNMDIVIGGGVESVSTVQGPKMFVEGDPWFKENQPDMYMSMLETAETVAARYGVSREAQDAYAAQSQDRTHAAQQAGKFDDEIVPLTSIMKVMNKETKEITEHEVTLEKDEGNRPGTTAESLGGLQPVFKDGLVIKEGKFITAGNASQLSDGASASVVMEAKVAEKKGLQPLGRYVGMMAAGLAPDEMGIGPIYAVPKLLKAHGLKVEDIGLWEFNEAFAVQVLHSANTIGIPNELMNVNGGACALGHPIGASGARILVTLLHALEQRDLKRGVAAICIGGGEALAVAIERE